MGIFPPELRDQRDLFGWAKRLGRYLRSTVLRSGRGISVQQTDSGTTVSLGNHSADHAPGGKDEIKFQTLEIVWTDPENPANQKKIIFNPNWEDFQAGRIFCVNDDGTFTGWRTLLDLVDDLTGFAAGKALKINEDGDGLEFGDAATEIPADVVRESTTTPFVSGKLVIASATAHELLGTLLGINVAGSNYAGYSDSDVSVDARVAQIADARIAAAGGGGSGSGTVTGTGVVGRPAIWSGTSEITEVASDETTAFPKYLRQNADGTWVMEDLEDSDLFTAEPMGELVAWGATNTSRLFKSGITKASVISCLTAPALGDVLYYDGTGWNVLHKPAGADGYLKNTTAGALSWGNPASVLATGSKGDILYHNGTEWARLAKPTSAKVLVNSAGGQPGWSFYSDFMSMGGAVGDVAIHDGTHWVRLAKPTTTAFLRNTAAGAVSWQTLASSLPSNVIYGGGVIGQIAVFDSDNLLGSAGLESLFKSQFPVGALVGGDWMFCYNQDLDQYGYNPAIVLPSAPSVKGQMLYYDGSNWKFLEPSGVRPYRATLECYEDGSLAWTEGLPATAQNATSTGKILYHNGTKWSILSKPTADKFLKNNAAGAVSWEDPLPAGAAGQILVHNGAAWVVLNNPSSEMYLKNNGAGAVSWAAVSGGTSLPSGTAGQILVHNGTAWVVLNKPGSDMFLKNTASGAVSWATPAAATVQSSGGTGASLVTSDGKIKTIYGY